MWRCPKCQLSYDDQISFCHKCGSKKPGMPNDLAGLLIVVSKLKKTVNILVILCAVLFLMIVGLAAVGFIYNKSLTSNVEELWKNLGYLRSYFEK